MATVQPPRDAPPAACPTCGLAGAGVDRRDPDGVHLLLYKCPVGHIWLTKWLEIACKHEWVSAELDLGDGSAVDQCAKCGLLTYVLGS